ncbi:hypothetical protein K5I29_02400 [Flavobacterium agricola]|uniref:Uncharacterized protein n=1 Tax=Flavobacterium agricola TaxID=2870839 RepID=A0ABY6M2Y3_9FLAO|nr:hypothetical protein [Flavobacterium agricola]UYW01795.1 hypothetical protein K5I29_02400 [Flavobacterium agricola]
MKQIQQDILNLNKDQLFEGKDINNKPIGFYSYATEVITKGRKKKGEPFDAKDTGEFFKGFYLELFENGFRLFSTDPKTHLILDSHNWLSDELFGLTDKDLKGVIDEKLLPFFIKHNRQFLGI